MTRRRSKVIDGSVTRGGVISFLYSSSPSMWALGSPFRFILARFKLLAKVADLFWHVVERLLQPCHSELLEPLAVFTDEITSTLPPKTSG